MTAQKSIGLTRMEHAVDPARAIKDAVGKSLPRPTGYKLLIGVYVRPEKTAGGVFITAKTRDEDRYQGKVGIVLALGPEAYGDEAKFTKGPWCKLGDWVIWKSLEGAGFELNGHPCRFINDDAVQGVLDGPDGVL